MFGHDELVPELLLRSLLLSSLWVLAISGVRWGQLQLPQGQEQLCPPQLPSQARAIPFHVCKPVPTLCLWGWMVAHSVEESRFEFYPRTTAVVR